MSESGRTTDERVAALAEPQRLGRWMDSQGLPGEGAPEVRHISGGASNEIFAVSRGGQELVLRRPPERVPPGRNEAMLREFRVLDALNATDVPHPRAVAVCDDESVLGAAFYLMELVDGWSCMATPGRWPAPYDTDLPARAGLADELVDGAAALAAVDWRAVGLDGFGRPDQFHERQVDRWLTQWESYRVRDLPGIDDAVSFLRGYTVGSYQPGIMHGDYQFANVMFRHGAPARLAAIVDWEMATIGDPLMDLAWFLMSWPNADEDRTVRSYVDYGGMPDREHLLERYATRSGRPVDEIDYYLVLCNFKMAIVLEGGYARMVKAGADEGRSRPVGEYVVRSAERAGALARSTSLRR